MSSGISCLVVYFARIITQNLVIQRVIQSFGQTFDRLEIVPKLFHDCISAYRFRRRTGNPCHLGLLSIISVSKLSKNSNQTQKDFYTHAHGKTSHAGHRLDQGVSQKIVSFQMLYNVTNDLLNYRLHLTVLWMGSSRIACLFFGLTQFQLTY